MATGSLTDSYGGYRAKLIEQLRQSGISDLAELAAFGQTPRHPFVPEAVRHRAYEDAPLPIGNNQTVSQPSVQGLYLQALELTGSERVLEIGTGSGYQTALLARLADQVISVERIPELAESARKVLKQLEISGVSIVVGDGTLGWRQFAPYDAILVSAASPAIPKPLLEQLTDGGHLVIPVARGSDQELIRVTRVGNKFREEWLCRVRFVPLIGKHGYRAKADS